MSDVHLEIAQQRGLIAQDDWQGWRLTDKGEGVISALMSNDGRGEYQEAARKLEARLLHISGYAWQLSTWQQSITACHPGRIRAHCAARDQSYTYWVSPATVLDAPYDVASIIAGEFEALIRNEVQK